MQDIRVGPWFAAALVAAFTPFVASDVRAGEFLLPLNGDNVIGAVSTAVAEHEDTLLDIGRRFGGRDHTTVLHAVRRIEELRALDPVLSADIETLARKLRD